MAEKFFWADAIADQIIKKNKGSKKFVCASGISPSGKVHIGNFREVITTDLVVRALKEKGKKVRFIYSWDDFDRFRKVPKNIDSSYEKYVGMSLSDFPSPFDKKKSYAEFFEEEFEKSLEKVGIKPEFIRQSVMNKKCSYANLIKIALEKRKEIMNILDKYRKEPLSKDWYPIAIYCEKCKKDFTKIISSEGYEVEYECKCGFKDKIDIRKKGIVGIKWRVDWPMRWKYEGVNFEPGGIDHSVHGGSFTTSKEIVKEVFNGEVPIYQFYDWVTVKGIELKEFHSSKGNVFTLNDVAEVYEPEILRYLFVGTKPKTGFQISFDNDVIKIYEDYDNLEKRYYERKVNPREKRIYEMSQIKLRKKKSQAIPHSSSSTQSVIRKKKPEKVSFRHLVTFIQTGKIKELNEDSKKRAEKVKNWLEKYAGEDIKFEVQKNFDVKLNKKEKESLLELRNVLKKKDYSEEELFNEFYDICEKVGIKNTEFFDAAYRVIINKKKGPRLAGLILAVGKDKIIKLLNQIK